jgi:hypothetical protein
MMMITMQVESVSLGPYKVTHPIISAKNNDWKTKIFTQSELKESNHSVASLQHNFTYVGDGTFYSAYEESGQWKLLRFGNSSSFLVSNFPFLSLALCSLLFALVS